MLVAPILAPLLAASVSPTWDLAPSGRYVEARTASVFAGACHYGGEATTTGREALLAWRVEVGRVNGVDLADTSIAAAIVDDRNLADDPSARRSVIYVDMHASAAVRTTLVEWLRASHADLLGDVVLVKSIALGCNFVGDAFRVDGGDTFLLQGSALVDRACCKMPFSVWYSPFERIEGRLVGNDTDFRFVEPRLDRTWSRPGENAAFLGHFGPTPSCGDTATLSASCGETSTSSALASLHATESMR